MVNLVLSFYFCVRSFLHDLEQSERKSHFSSVLCRASYRIVKYSGYAGDLSPKSALELIQGNENAVLVDIRPEVGDFSSASCHCLQIATF